MKAEEIHLIESKHNAAIIAPAGHGKTEMITEIVDKLPGKKLVLTHTNAGVAALAQRLSKKQIKKEKFHLSTISSFCMMWCGAYPKTADVNSGIGITDNEYYPMVHAGAARIFSHLWARNVIKNTYACVIVDEYQDCVLNQHQIFVEINKTVPVYVLGDPLQAIFGFKEHLVSWNNMCFDVLRNEIETYPWRWEKTNPALGRYLSTVRQELLPSLDGREVRLSINTDETAVYKISPTSIHGPEFNYIMKQYKSILYIAKWPKDTASFAKGTGGLFQNDEKQNLDELYKYARLLDTDDGYARARSLFEFICECSSNASTELKTYGGHIVAGDFDFHLARKYPEFGVRILKVYQTHSHNEMLALLEWVRTSKSFRIHRQELFVEMQRAIRRSRDLQIPILQAAQEIRMIPGTQSQYSGFKRLSSRTLLSKGLEFECVVIDLSKAQQGGSNRYSATEMYVAMTRAMKAIYFITDYDHVILSVPQGVL